MKRVFAWGMAVLMLFVLTACDSGDYKAAVERMENGDYAAAADAFRALGEYEDSAAQAQKCDYQLALSVLESGDYAAAADAFRALGEYEDSAALAQSCDYRLALAAFESGDYAAAVTAFEALDGYEDSGDYILRARDELLREKLTGVWVYGYDIGSEEVALLAEELGELPELPALVMDLVLELKEDGGLSVALNEEKLRQDVEPFLDAVIAAMVDLIAAESGMEPEDLCTALGVGSVEELYAMLKEEGGLNADAFLGEILSDEMYVEGTWNVENGVITAVLDGETEELSYDSAADTLGLPSYDGSGEAETLFFER